VWNVIEAATREMEATNQQTFLQVATKAAGCLSQEQVKPYRHVIIDEGQDLHEAQWRLLRAAVAPAADDLFIVGDAHQRIYGRRSSLSKVGITSSAGPASCGSTTGRPGRSCAGHSPYSATASSTTSTRAPRARRGPATTASSTVLTRRAWVARLGGT
jgi:hypothetical protein